MRTFLVVLWLTLPFGAWAYHEGPGQEQALLDEVQSLNDAGRRAADAELWALAVERYAEALEKLPAERVAEARRIRLDLNVAKMNASQLPEAHADLEKLVTELASDPEADAKLADDARRALASAQFFMTWLMRLEGLPREEWEPEIEAARQSYRLLAEKATLGGDDAAAARDLESLESTVRLARLDLDELQGLPLPSQ